MHMQLAVAGALPATRHDRRLSALLMFPDALAPYTRWCLFVPPTVGALPWKVLCASLCCTLTFRPSSPTPFPSHRGQNPRGPAGRGAA